MKTVLFCGGLGTRLSEYTDTTPKPMVELVGEPLVCHVMQCYSRFGLRDFVLALGYKGFVFKNFFSAYGERFCDFTVDLETHATELISGKGPNWRISLIDTGQSSMTGHRLWRLRDFLKNEDMFCLSYGDGLGNVDISSLIKFHKAHGRIATVTAVKPPARFGELNLSNDAQVISFDEKPQLSQGWISGGFFVFGKRVFDYLTPNEDLIFERGPLTQLSTDGELMAYTHDGFWSCVDSKRDLTRLEALAADGSLPWLQ